MSVEDQIALVNDLLERTQSVVGHWEAYQAADNLIAGLKGERLPTCVNPEVYG